MEQGSLVIDLLLLIAIATVGVALFERLRLPSIAAFLVMGAIVGPGGLGVVEDPERVRELAELGVVFLLFEIALELPMERVRRLWKRALLVGGLQVAATLLCVAAAGIAFGLNPPTAFVVGGLVAMSSTALVMRVLAERGELDAPHGQIAVGVLLFQDLSIVPLLLAVPLLASGQPGGSGELALGIARAGVALAIFAALFRFVLPRVLERAAQLQSREVFTMMAFLVVVGSAVIAKQIGLTLSVGAFVGGLVLSASPYAHQLFAEVVPLRGLLLGVFFAAVGMLFDPRMAAEQWLGIVAYAGGVIFLKAGFVVAIVAVALRQGLRLGILSGLALAQTGEFSFVLAVEAARAGLLDENLQQIFVGGSVVTLVATPFLVAAAPRLAAVLTRDRADPTADAEAEEGPTDHVVIVGFGLAGQSLARVLRARETAYMAVEANAASVREARERGEPVLYGDATRRALLERLGISRARLMVVVISDPLASREVASLARSLAPELPIVVRTRYVREVDEIARAGASRVVVEEFESTLELLGDMLQRLGVPRESVLRFAAELRDEGYVFLRTPEVILDPWLAELLEEVDAHWVDVPDTFVGERSLGELAIRGRSGVTVLAVERAGSTESNPPAAFALRAGDRLLVLGETEQVERLSSLLAERTAPQ